MKSLEVGGKGSLGLAWPDLVKIVRMQSSRWSSVSKLERWVCRKVGVLAGQVIKCLRIYDEGRFISVELGKYCKEVGIK